jgi:uncharacterized membrane protein YkvA (DUF1232 family)
MLERLRTWARAMRRESVAIYLAIRDPRTPWTARLLGGIVLAYAASPLDLVPDFVPVLGVLDDLLIVPVGLWLVVLLVPAEVLEEARAQADAELAQPRSMAAAVFVVAVWIAALALAVAIFRRVFS